MNGLHDKLYTYEESIGQLKYIYMYIRRQYTDKTWRNKITENTKVKMQYMEVKCSKVFALF